MMIAKLSRPMIRPVIRPVIRIAALLGGAAMLSGCFLQPGSFDSTMTVLEDGRFTFAYEGEIVMAGLGDMSEMADAANANAPCTDEDSGKQRPCTTTELNNRAAEKAQQRAMMQAMMGDTNMANPQQVAEFIATLERQAGWNSVEMVEEGVFEVSFSITSRMGHDFDFPTIEGMPLGSSFVQARLRDDSRLRIEAPGFVGQNSANPMGGMMMGMFGAMAQTKARSSEQGGPASGPALTRPIEGTFRLVTNAAILANNTDEGPQDGPNGMDMLSWTITPGAASAPSALLGLDLSQ